MSQVTVQPTSKARGYLHALYTPSWSWGTGTALCKYVVVSVIQETEVMLCVMSTPAECIQYLAENWRRANAVIPQYMSHRFMSFSSYKKHNLITVFNL